MFTTQKLGNVKRQVGELAIEGGRKVKLPLTQDDRHEEDRAENDENGPEVVVSVKTMKMVPITGDQLSWPSKSWMGTTKQ